jgi:nucleoside 2-deoxyribosyltransferase
MKKIYCAGPLFNSKEQQEMLELSQFLEGRGYRTFLPQRDGLELTKCITLLAERGIAVAMAQQLMAKAIFALDVYQVLEGCDAVVANLNGRVPDEGTVSEAAMAWARGKTVVGYKSDSRSVFGGQDNPLVTGLFGFSLCSSFDAVASVLEAGMEEDSKATAFHREEELSLHLQLGGIIWRTLQEARELNSVVNLLLEFQGQGAASRA